MRDALWGDAASVAVALLCLSLAGPALAATTGSSGVPVAGDSPVRQAEAPPAFQSAVDPDAVVLRADVGEDGTAAWTVEFRVRLDDENTSAAFDTVRTDVQENASAFTTQFATGMGRTVTSAEDSTDREMGLENVTVTATRERLPQEYGVLTYRFTWTDFAVTDGERLRVGDSLSGFFLDRESSLVLAWPAGYESRSVTPSPDETGNASVTWRGPADFGPNEPRVVAAPGGGLPTTALVALTALFVTVAAGGWFYRSRSVEEAGAAGAVGSTAAADADETGDTDGGVDEPSEELLSSGERVIRLLEDNGGRVKQQQIAGEFGWTDAKTSQVVGTLRDEDAVETFRIGRENVVALPEESYL